MRPARAAGPGRSAGQGAVKTFATRPREEPRRRASCALCGSDEAVPHWDCGGFSFARCPRCGLLRQDPQPEAAAVAARYAGAEYLAYEEANQLAYRDLELRTLGDLGLDEAAAPLFAAAAAADRRPRALDVGCATGALLDALRERGWEPEGVEIGAAMAEYGRARYGLAIKACALEEAGFEDGRFALVHASHLVEHLNDPASFLDEALRVLAPGGLLVLTTPNAEGFQARLLGPAWRSAINDHLYLFSARTLEALLESRGLVPLRRVTWGGWAAGLKPAFLKKPLDAWAKRSGRGDVVAFLAARRGA